MIIKECRDEVIQFLQKYPNPSIVQSSTIKDGYVTCIKPIPTICGSELICSENTRSDLLKLIRQVQIGVD
jgi:hypothetical protein